ncbi:hypothetical protein M6D81_04575 [Paenibacillus sp. J5C_2022]|nr:hypothetical protein [Paenibacillus sp. J5C2022]MCU6707981.1 hypothetical protein [Paenibacillus sp. J5C2022]
MLPFELTKQAVGIGIEYWFLLGMGFGFLVHMIYEHVKERK